MDTLNKHERTRTWAQHHAQTHGAPSGAEFLIHKYTPINQTALPHAQLVSLNEKLKPVAH